ncbi:MAG: rhomboid family intramembrane serine protease, partial [Alphaproteobacteria bacterium]
MAKSPPAINAPRAVVYLLGALVLVHMLRWLVPVEVDNEILRLFAFIPSRYSSTPLDFVLGTGGAPAAVWSVVTYMFLHGDITHLMVNNLWLLAFGSALAWRIGSARFAVFTVFCGAAGVFLHLAMNWGENALVIGASAAISGHMAAAIRFVFQGPGVFGALGGPAQMHGAAPLLSIRDTFRDRRCLAFLAVWAVINLVFGLG